MVSIVLRFVQAVPPSPEEKKKRASSKKSSKKDKADAQPWQTGTAVTGNAAASLWKATLDPGSGKYYYYHTGTKVTQWDPPSEGYSEA